MSEVKSGSVATLGFPPPIEPGAGSGRGNDGVGAWGFGKGGCLDSRPRSSRGQALRGNDGTGSGALGWVAPWIPTCVGMTDGGGNDGTGEWCLGMGGSVDSHLRGNDGWGWE